MSIEVSTLVWKYSAHSGSALLLLLKIADNCHDDGSGAFPSVAHLAERTRMSERNVQYLLRSLERSGELEVDRRTGRQTSNRYRIRIDVLTTRDLGVQSLHSLGVQPSAVGVQPSAVKGAIAVAPEPSVEPSIEQSLSPRASETEILPTPSVNGARDPWDPPEDINHLRLSRDRRAVFDAYWQATGQTSRHQRNKAHHAAEYELVQVQSLGELPEPSEMRMMTAYLIADRRSGNIPSIPTLAQVLDRRGEFDAWLSAWRAAGEPRIGGHGGDPDYLLLRKRPEQRGKRKPIDVGPAPPEVVLDNILWAAEERVGMIRYGGVETVEGALDQMLVEGEITDYQHASAVTRRRMEESHAT